jgi:hypothetical protein
MIHLRHAILTLLGAFLSAVSLLVFLVGVPLLVNRSLSPAEQVGGTLFYTVFSIVIAFASWRMFSAARKISAASKVLQALPRK